MGQCYFVCSAVCRGLTAESAFLQSGGAVAVTLTACTANGVCFAVVSPELGTFSVCVDLHADAV